MCAHDPPVTHVASGYCGELVTFSDLTNVSSYVSIYVSNKCTQKIDYLQKQFANKAVFPPHMHFKDLVNNLFIYLFF